MEFIVEKNRIYCQDKEAVLLAEVLFPDIDAGAVAVTHTFVDESLRGQGIADQLMIQAVLKIREDGKRVQPVCSYAVKWFEKHPEEGDLLIEVAPAPDLKEAVMSQLLLIGYPRCSTSNKAQKWLDEQGVAYTFRHIVENNPNAEELSLWQQRSGLPLRRFFNTSGKLYRELNIKSQLDSGIADDEAFALLASDGMMVKRPLLIGTDFVLVGFKESEWERVIK